VAKTQLCALSGNLQTPLFAIRSCRWEIPTSLSRWGARKTPAK